MGKFIPYGRQYIDNEDIQVVIDVLKSDFLTQGPNISKFEKFFSKEVHSNYSVAFNSATSALHIACLALGLMRIIIYGLLLLLLWHLQIVVYIAGQKLIS